jgi:integrase
MSIRKRGWVNGDGSRTEIWTATYTDQGGKRRARSFERKRDAEAFHATVSVDVRRGLHIPESQSIMVAEAARIWLGACESSGLEPTTIAAYRQHVDLHIIPLLGAVKLSTLTAPMARAFEDRLRKDRSPAMVRKVRASLGSILAEAQERGLVAQNVVRALRVRRQSQEARADARAGTLKIGTDIPSPDEIRALIAHLDGHWRPLFITAIFTGLRASELRGLRWGDVDLRRNVLHVRQRADRFNTMGRLKSKAGERDVPLPPLVINTLREHRLNCPKGELGLVFPNGRGRVENMSNIVRRGLQPAMAAAGIIDRDGKPKYTGLHAFRHFYASWCINRRADGGLELPLKTVQVRLGHASIQMTADTYGHLFPSSDNGAELAAAEKVFLGA